MDPAVPELPRRSRHRRARRARMLAAAAGAALLAVAAIAVTAAARDNAPSSLQVRQAANVSADTTAALTDNWYESAPYYSVLDSDAPDLGTVMAATGQKAFDMAFILADGSSCTPAWNGTDPASSDTQVAAV